MRQWSRSSQWSIELLKRRKAEQVPNDKGDMFAVALTLLYSVQVTHKWRQNVSHVLSTRKKKMSKREGVLSSRWGHFNLACNGKRNFSSPWCWCLSKIKLQSTRRVVVCRDSISRTTEACCCCYYCAREGIWNYFNFIRPTASNLQLNSSCDVIPINETCLLHLCKSRALWWNIPREVSKSLTGYLHQWTIIAANADNEFHWIVFNIIQHRREGFNQLIIGKVVANLVNK